MRRNFRQKRCIIIKEHIITGNKKGRNRCEALNIELDEQMIRVGTHFMMGDKAVSLYEALLTVGIGRRRHPHSDLESVLTA